MSQSNQKTIEAYDKNVEKYVRGANSQINGMIGDSVRVWLDGILDSLNKDAKILEIGSGSV